ncbi:coumaroyl-CoA:anthocyanidin 3-O-glucoside-6''-O-coumaroyltransferase 2-like [Rutidosis leptorrhynchoides]|uniref:coumaroyl-CoA:anthocyanidin 3-O-glucoside-6''-O-coumaroyltransferase 2-like n=1 Tax=Rutidosis leptorrhynchoides TaxID=125765 RepID=UPI003A9A4791
MLCVDIPSSPILKDCSGGRTLTGNGNELVSCARSSEVGKKMTVITILPKKVSLKAKRQVLSTSGCEHTSRYMIAKSMASHLQLPKGFNTFGTESVIVPSLKNMHDPQLAMAHKVKVINEFRVAPPPGSLPSTIYQPLTFFDLRFLILTHRQTMTGLSFYSYPQSLHHLTQITIPSLISSLSHNLKFFYPFVSSLILPASPQKPYILFAEGNSVSFTVAHYSDNDFDELISYQTKPVHVLRMFAPNLPPPHVSPDGSHVESLLAIQVTLFPNKGICVGIGFRHVVADGTAFNNFIQSWSSICRSNGTVEIDKFPMPTFNKDAIRDPYELEAKLLQKWHDYYSSFQECEIDNIYADKVRSTFVLKHRQIRKLKKYFTNNGLVNLSSYVVTCSFIWVWLLKSLEESRFDADNKVCRLSIPADCRNQLGLPTTYFGNCVAASFAVAKRSELVEQNGFLVASRAIGNCIKEFKSDGALRGVQKLVTEVEEQLLLGPSDLLFVIMGSPKFDHLKTDFGWGSPNKLDVLHPDSIIAVNLNNYCKDEEGGIEFGLELTKAEMDAFTKHYYHELANSLL